MKKLNIIFELMMSPFVFLISYFGNVKLKYRYAPTGIIKEKKLFKTVLVPFFFCVGMIVTPVGINAATKDLSINDVSLNEGDSGTTTFTFTVTTSGDSGQVGDVNYTTSEGSAAAGSDYNTSSGTLSFGNGVISNTITIEVYGDTIPESDEIFKVILSNATGALTIIDGEGIGTILDDDTPTISIANNAGNEGNIGTSNLNFTVTLSKAAPTGGVSVDYATSDATATTVNGDYVSSSGTLTIGEGNTTGTISVTINGDTAWELNETFNVTLSNPTNAILGTAIATGTIIDDDSLGSCPSFSPEFTLEIDGSEENITGLSGGPYSFSGSTDDRYWEFNATAAPGEDINGTLRVNLYASNFNEICNFELLDQNCQPVPGYSWSNKKGQEFAIYVDTNTTYYLHIGDTCGNNPQVVVAMLWYPDTNGTVGSYGFAYDEPAIFRGTDYTPSGNVFDSTKDFVRTKIVNKEHDLTISVVKDDGTIFTGYKGIFRFDLVDATDYGTIPCSLLPRIKFNGTLGIKSNDNGIITTGDNSDEHGPPLVYDRAVKNVKYRMSYLVNNADGGIINYEDLLNFNGCLGNKQSCLWGVLISMANSGQDPYLPDYTIADVCGLYCDPGTGEFGTGNNQISEECADCVFGPGYSDCSDHFAIRPDKFDVNITLGDILIAGKATSLAFEALDGATTPAPTLDYNETETTSFTVDINISDTTKVCQNPDIDMTPDVDFTDGLDEGDFVFHDVGDVNMTIHEINGSEFAIIDADDTDDTERLITELNVSFRIIPDHFNIDANLTDHNDVNNFTYLHDINQYDSDDNYSMAAALTIDIEARGADENITRNYMETCYAKDTNLTLVLNEMNITYPGSILPPALTQFLYYNPMDDNGSVESGEGNYSLPNPIVVAGTNTIVTPSLTMKNSTLTFPADAPDGNGTTHVEYKLNFDRKLNLAVNPFRMELTDVNITDEDNVTGNQTSITDQNATMYYARTRSSIFFYDDVTDSSVKTDIAIDVYCDLDFAVCLDIGINVYSAQTDEFGWWLSLGHIENSTQQDGNVTLRIIAGTPTPSGATASVAPTNVQITPSPGNTPPGGINTNVTVTATSAHRPMLVPIELVNKLDPGSPAYDLSALPYTNHWLIYNEDSPTEVPSPFYKVLFRGLEGWAGHGKTGHVVDSNSSTKKNRRLGW